MPFLCRPPEKRSNISEKNSLITHQHHSSEPSHGSSSRRSSHQPRIRTSTWTLHCFARGSSDPGRDSNLRPRSGSRALRWFHSSHRRRGSCSCWSSLGNTDSAGPASSVMPEGRISCIAGGRYRQHCRTNLDTGNGRFSGSQLSPSEMPHMIMSLISRRSIIRKCINYQCTQQRKKL